MDPAMDEVLDLLGLDDLLGITENQGSVQSPADALSVIDNQSSVYSPTSASNASIHSPSYQYEQYMESPSTIPEQDNLAVTLKTTKCIFRTASELEREGKIGL